MNIVDVAIANAQEGNLNSYALALAAGVATSIGPCVAPRYAAIAAIGEAANRTSWIRLFAFVAGTILAYTAIASVGSVVIRLVQASPEIYWILALALIVSGIVQLFRSDEHACAAHRNAAPTFGGAFLLGAATSTAVSPCCTPILLGLGALSGATSGTSALAGHVAAFTVGHLAPVVLLFAAAGAVRSTIIEHREAASTVTAAVTIALGCYYAVLA